MKKLKSVPPTIRPNGVLLHLLPRTPEDLDTFVESITEEFGLPPGEGTYEAIASAIMHMPANQAYAPRMHFGHIGLKQMAQTAAYERLQGINERRKAARTAAEAAAKEKKGADSPAGADVGQPIQNP